MRIFQALTSSGVALALALVGMAITIAQISLPAIGYELSPGQGYGLLILVALFGVGAVIALFWHSLKRIRISLAPASNEPEWAKLPLEPIVNTTFRDQPIPLDGFAYDSCTFVRCTFVYKGEKPFSLKNFRIEGDLNVAAASPALDYFSTLLNVLKFLHKDIEVTEELQPRPEIPVAYGEVQRAERPDEGTSPGR